MTLLSPCLGPALRTRGAGAEASGMEALLVARRAACPPGSRHAACPRGSGLRPLLWLWLPGAALGHRVGFLGFSLVGRRGKVPRAWPEPGVSWSRWPLGGFRRAHAQLLCGRCAGPGGLGAPAPGLRAGEGLVRVRVRVRVWRVRNCALVPWGVQAAAAGGLGGPGEAARACVSGGSRGAWWAAGLGRGPEPGLGSGERACGPGRGEEGGRSGGAPRGLPAAPGGAAVFAPPPPGAPRRPAWAVPIRRLVCWGWI